MPIRKFRDISEIEEPRHGPGSRRLYEVIRHVGGLSDLICPLRFPEGVFRHRTIPWRGRPSRSPSIAAMYMMQYLYQQLVLP